MSSDRQERLSSQPAEVESLLERVRHQQRSEQDFRLLERLLCWWLRVVRLLEQKQTSLARLKRAVRISLGPISAGSPPHPTTLHALNSKHSLRRAVRDAAWITHGPETIGMPALMRRCRPVEDKPAIAPGSCWPY
jgi:hypothetical protein